MRHWPQRPGQKAHLSAALLALLMATTRLHHFLFPDASLAVFFLAGYLVPSVRLFLFLLLLAGLVDFAAIRFLGVSAYCVTPAYAFLVPTYGSVWWAGRVARRWDFLDLRLWAVALGAGLLAFLISNVSFWALSGYFEGMGLFEYGQRVVRYLPPYLFALLLYLALVGLPYTLVKRWSAVETGTR